jgi:hypothetical protein
MKFLFLLLLSLPLLAQEEDQQPKHRRLESVVIDAREWKVRVNVSEGHNDRSGNFVADKLLPEYTIDPDERLMILGDEKRSFNEDVHKAAEEGEALNAVLQKLTRYAIDSVVWWEAGEGVVLPKKEKASLPPPQCNPCPYFDFGASSRSGALVLSMARPR